MEVLDLFCGAGGLARGFEKAGFHVTGVDFSRDVEKTFELNSRGEFIRADLSRELIYGKFDLIVGGPPCRPWSTVNITKRGKTHADYHLISRFFLHVIHHLPRVFMLENVPALAKDNNFNRYVGRVRKLGYSIVHRVISYGDFGAPTRRRRLIVFGTRAGCKVNFFEMLEKYRSPPRTVRDAIWWLRDKERGVVPDHVWPELRTIRRYRGYYMTGKFGWYVLRWDEPAPSFGNIMKTYILHPDSFNGSGITARVISVKEALLIMGFDQEFRFPADIGVSSKYQMVADAVSPVFSYVAAQAIKNVIKNDEG